MKKMYVLLIIIAMLFSACQETPEEPVVQSKDKDLVNEVMEANEEENQQQLVEDKEIIEQQIEAINKHLSMEHQINDRVKVVVDADVSIPTYQKIPFVRARPENFTEEHLKALIAEVCGNNPVYLIEDRTLSASKEEIQDKLLLLNSFLQNDSLAPHIVSHINDRIESLKERYPMAKNKSEEKPYGGGLIPVENNINYITNTSLKCYLGRTEAAIISMAQVKNNAGNLSFMNDNYGLPYNIYEPYEGVDADKIDMSYEECRHMADDLVRALDGEDTNMVLAKSQIGYATDFFAGHTKKTAPQCYSFLFAREYNGVTVKPVSIFYQGNDINYSQQVSPEIISISIDNDGFNFVNWSNYTNYMETLAEDVPLMDFDSVNSIFEDYCRYKFSWVPQYDNVPKDATVTIDIHSVALNLMVTPEKDNLDTYIMIPVWDFVGDINYDQEITAQDGYPYEGPKDVAVLTINAIDGTIIDREQGY